MDRAAKALNAGANAILNDPEDSIALSAKEGARFVASRVGTKARSYRPNRRPCQVQFPGNSRMI